MSYLKKTSDGLKVLLEEIKTLAIVILKALMPVLGILVCVDVLAGTSIGIITRAKAVLAAVGISQGLLTGVILAVIIIMLYNQKPKA